MARGLMSDAVFARVLGEVAKHVPPIRVAVLYHGGEPLLNKRFPEMARRIKDLGIPLVKTVTNGMFLRGENIPAIVRSGLDLIEISLDGASSEESDAVRRRSSFKRIASNVIALAEHNRTEGRPLQIFVSTTQFKRRGDEGQATTPAWLRSTFARYPEIDFKPTWAMVWPNWQPKQGFKILPPPADYQAPKSCSLIDETITIRADGTAVVCCYDLATTSNLGNILETDLVDIWNGAHSHFTEKFARGDFPAPCDSCGVVIGERFLIPIVGHGNSE
jgi:MoaA/NifB/PqqE/SkfB family radical SAM enzyme